MSVAYASAAPGEKVSGRQAWSLLVKASRPLAAGVGLWVAASAVVPALVVVALGVMVGAVPGAVKHGLGSAQGHRLIVALVVAALIYGLSLVLDSVGTALGTAAKSRITAGLQRRLIDAVSAPIGVAHLEDTSVLDRLSRAEGSLTGYFPGDAPVTWAGIISSRLAGVVGCAVIAFEFHWWLGLGLLIMWLGVRRLVLAPVMRQAIDMRGQTPSMRRAWYLAGVGSKARDAKEVRVFGLSDFVAARFSDEYRDAIRGGIPGLRQLHLRALIGFAIVLTGYATSLGLIAYQAHSGDIDLRSLAIVLPMLAVTSSVGSVAFDDITLAWTLAGLPDVDSLERDLLAGRRDVAGSTALQGRPHRAVRFESVRFRYPGSDVDVLDGLDLEFVAGTSTAIVGVNGAGKSTLISLLSRLRDPSSGRIVIDDVDVQDLDPIAWQRTVALMPQEPARYPFSVYDNVAFGAIEHRDDRAGVDAVAATTGLDAVIARLPEGWNTVLSRELPGGVELSGGQWQRVALARALFATRHGAKVLVLDEPTAALDVRSEARFYEQFFEITEGLTSVVISHRFATVRRAHTICVLDGGRITERGTHAELVAAGGQYAQMYELQARRFEAAEGAAE